MKATNLSNLVDDAVRHGEASASSGKWRAYRDTIYMAALSERGRLSDRYAVEVWHHNTAMMRVYPGNTVIPLDPGYGSTSDRCGVRRITEGAGCGIGYRELYGEGS